MVHNQDVKVYVYAHAHTYELYGALKIYTPNINSIELLGGEV